MVELSECLWVPETDIDGSTLQALTLRQYLLSGDTVEVEGFRKDRQGYIGVPRNYALKSISKVIDRRSKGVAVKYPRQVKLRDYQNGFVDSIYRKAKAGEDHIAKAATGKGKTVCGLAVAARLGVTTVVVVDQESLLDQWVERAKEHLGLSSDQIGIVQGKTCDYKDKHLTVCMIQTLVSRSFPTDFYSYFGLAIFDESHSVGAPVFSRALMSFTARSRLGLSATPKRRDALQKLLDWNLGGVQVSLESDLLPASVYVLEHDTTYSWRVNNSKLTGRFLEEISNDGSRNLLIAQATMWLYESGRDVLVISDRIEQLNELMSLCAFLGLPSTDMGLFAKSKVVYRYEKDPRPTHKPHGHERGTDYTPVRLVTVQKTVKKAELERVKQEAKVIFATYGLMAKGVDIPRLSAGIDATPRSTATQVYGRILRVLPGKLRPIWVTIADRNSFRSLYQLGNRLHDYHSSKAEVYLWKMGKGVKLLDSQDFQGEIADRVKTLRSSRIVTQLDGNYTLLT